MGNINGKLDYKILSKEKNNYSNNNKNINQKYSQIIKIDENDINKDIYFLDNIDDEEEYRNKKEDVVDID